MFSIAYFIMEIISFELLFAFCVASICITYVSNTGVSIPSSFARSRGFLKIYLTSIGFPARRSRVVDGLNAPIFSDRYHIFFFFNHTKGEEDKEKV